MDTLDSPYAQHVSNINEQYSVILDLNCDYIDDDFPYIDFKILYNDLNEENYNSVDDFIRMRTKKIIQDVYSYLDDENSKEETIIKTFKKTEDLNGTEEEYEEIKEYLKDVHKKKTQLRKNNISGGINKKTIHHNKLSLNEGCPYSNKDSISQYNLSSSFNTIYLEEKRIKW